MRALLQRVARASVEIGGQEAGAIGGGLLVFLGVAREDAEADAQHIVDKTVNLRIFADADNRFNLSALDVGAELLVVSQFTLHADTRRGRRPDFTQAAAPAEAQRLYDYAIALFRQTGLRVATGQFQEHMRVSLVNDGPVTLLLDSADKQRPRRG